MKHTDSQRGNVFFLILIAIVLFGAFTFAVSHSGSSEGNTTSESDKIAASRIIAYGNILKDTVDQLRNNGISEADISFANSTVTGYGTVGANPTAEVFNASGGAITYEKPDARWIDSTYSLQNGYGAWAFVGTAGVEGVGTPLTGSCGALASCKELVAVLPFVRRSVCDALNKQLGSGDSNGAPYISSTFRITIPYVGSYAAGAAAINDSVGNLLKGKYQGCVQSSGTNPGPAGSYHYFQVLIAR